MKSRLLFIALTLSLFISAIPSFSSAAVLFFDNFEDGVYADRWEAIAHSYLSTITESAGELHLYSQRPSHTDGETAWVLTQTKFSSPNLSITARIRPMGWGGIYIMIWKDDTNFIRFGLTTDDVPDVEASGLDNGNWFASPFYFCTGRCESFFGNTRPWVITKEGSNFSLYIDGAFQGAYRHEGIGDSNLRVGFYSQTFSWKSGDADNYIDSIEIADNAQIPVSSGVRFWAKDVGNYWTYNGTNPYRQFQWKDEIVGVEDYQGISAYVQEGRYWDAGDWELDEKTWLSVGLSELRFLQNVGYDEDHQQWYAMSVDPPGMLWAKNPFQVGDSWPVSATGTYSTSDSPGGPPNSSMSISITGTVSVTDWAGVQTPLGTYRAYRIVYSLAISELQATIWESWWHVPYLGQIEWADLIGSETDLLTSLHVKRWITDFNGDQATDLAIYRQDWGTWFLRVGGGASITAVGWGGEPTDIPVPGDYDGDGRVDVAVYRKGDGAWWIIPSSTGVAYGAGFGGGPTDIPVPGDYDGDGRKDIAIYRQEWGAWYIQPSGGGAVTAIGWGGNPTDVPVPGDYDGDGKTDVAIYRKSSGAWWIIPSSTGIAYGVGHGGGATDIPVPGDYDGDGKTDIAIYRQEWGAWYIRPSAGGSMIARGWGGAPTDLPVPGDYDGDGIVDIAIYRKSDGAWWIIPSASGIPYGVGFGGGATDIPVMINPAMM